VEYRKLGNSEIDASVVGLGGWAIEDRRDKVVLATKCGLWWQDKTGSFFATVEGRDVRRSLAPRTIRQEIEGSLRRLRTDWIDLYQGHWPAMEPEKTPVGETMECLMALRREGKIRAVGVCNTPPSGNWKNTAGRVNSPRISSVTRCCCGTRSKMFYRGAATTAQGLSRICRLSRGCSRARWAWIGYFRRRRPGATRNGIPGTSGRTAEKFSICWVDGPIYWPSTIARSLSWCLPGRRRKGA
jgi:hypothetical protein